MKASYQAFFLSSLSSEGKETASSHYTRSLFSLGRKKKITFLSKSTVLSILLLFTKRSCQTIQAKIGIVLKSQYQDLNETELEALTVLYFHPKFSSCWFYLHGIDPCSLREALMAFSAAAAHIEMKSKWRAGRFLGSPNLPPQAVAQSWCLQGSRHTSLCVLGLRPSAKHLHPLAPHGEGTEVSELPKWSSYSGREGFGRGIVLLFGVFWLSGGIECFFLYWVLIIKLHWKLCICAAFIGCCQQQATFRAQCVPQTPAEQMPSILLLVAGGWGLIPWELHTYTAFAHTDADPNIILPVWSNQEWNVTRLYPCHIQTSPGCSSSLCCLQDLSMDHRSPSTLLPPWVPSLSLSCCGPSWVVVPGDAQPHKMYHHH